MPEIPHETLQRLFLSISNVLLGLQSFAIGDIVRQHKNEALARSYVIPKTKTVYLMNEAGVSASDFEQRWICGFTESSCKIYKAVGSTMMLS